KPPLVVATNGRSMVVIESEAEQTEETTQSSFVLASQFLKAFLPFAKSRALAIRFEPHLPKRVLAHLNGGEVLDMETGAVIEGDYPNWRLVAPTGKKETVQTFGV